VDLLKNEQLTDECEFYNVKMDKDVMDKDGVDKDGMNKDGM
jgi:hypothetical protein